MTSWSAEASNYLHKLATCIVAVISESNERQDYAHRSDRTTSDNLLEGRNQEIQIASAARPRVFCTGARHWICRLKDRTKQGWKREPVDMPKQRQDLHTRSTSINLLGGRDQRIHVGSSSGSRVFCTGARHWICRLKARNKLGRERESVHVPKERQYILSTKSKLGDLLDMTRL